MAYILGLEIGIIFQLVIFCLLENNMSYFLVRKKNPHLWFQGHCSHTILINIIQNRRHLSSVSVCSSWITKLWNTWGYCIAWWFQRCAVAHVFWILCVYPTPSPLWVPSGCPWRSHDNQRLLLFYHVYSERQWHVSSSLPAARYRLPSVDKWVTVAMWICDTRIFSHTLSFLSLILEGYSLNSRVLSNSKKVSPVLGGCCSFQPALLIQALLSLLPSLGFPQFLSSFILPIVSEWGECRSL